MISNYRILRKPVAIALGLAVTVVIATSVWVQVNRARALEQQAEERSRRAKQAIEQAIRDVGQRPEQER